MIPPNVTGAIYRIWANTSSLTPSVYDEFRACLENPPELSIHCWANPNTERLYYSKPGFPVGLTVGLCFLVLVLALAGAMTVRSFVLWYFDRKAATSTVVGADVLTDDGHSTEGTSTGFTTS